MLRLVGLSADEGSKFPFQFSGGERQRIAIARGKTAAHRKQGPSGQGRGKPHLHRAIGEGIRRATRKVPLRPNVVDPLTRKNTGDNTGPGIPAIHVGPGDELRITVLPKGAGAENVSRIGMLLPTEAGAVGRFVAETVLIAEGRPCPPVILGVGIGGTFDTAAAMAKEALLLPVDTMDGYEQQI